MKVKYKIVPEMVYIYTSYEKHPKYRLYRKTGFFSGWEYLGYYDSSEDAEKAIKNNYKSYLRYSEERKLQNEKKKQHLSQKVIYKDMP